MGTFMKALSVLIFLGHPHSVIGAERTAEPRFEHPATVALSKQDNGRFTYNSFPGGLPLYVFDGDLPGKSMCDQTCVAVWPVLRAEPESRSVGDWSIIVRDDGRRQWAYKNRPVYTFYSDEPGIPKGVGKEEGWYYDEPIEGTPLAAAKVALKPKGTRPVWRLVEP